VIQQPLTDHFCADFLFKRS